MTFFSSLRVHDDLSLSHTHTLTQRSVEHKSDDGIQSHLPLTTSEAFKDKNLALTFYPKVNFINCSSSRQEKFLRS